MDPTPTCCPHRPCPASGQPGQGHLGLHAQQEQRCICHACQPTCSAPPGTVVSRLRPSAAPGGLVVPLRAPGGPVPALVAACGWDERTGAAGWARSGRQGQAVHAYWVAHPRDLGQVPADERRVKQPGGMVWRARARMVRTRLGWGGAGRAQRDMPLSRRLLQRGRRGAARRPLVSWPDGWGAALRAMRATLRAPVPTGQGGRPRWRPWRHLLSAQVGTRDARRRVVDPERRLVKGTPVRVETLRQRSPGAGVRNTADSARRNATCRARLALRARRCRAVAREPLPLPAGLGVVGTVSTLCMPHASLGRAPQTTPARAAGSPDQGGTRQALLAFHVPLPRGVPPKQRGRPSRAWQRLIKRWCS